MLPEQGIQELTNHIIDEKSQVANLVDNLVPHIEISAAALAKFMVRPESQKLINQIALQRRQDLERSGLWVNEIRRKLAAGNDNLEIEQLDKTRITETIEHLLLRRQIKKVMDLVR